MLISTQSIMVLVFFIPYIVFQPLATAIIRAIGPRIFISSIVMTWGAVLIVRSLDKALSILY
jgi:hypothetical protein